MNPRDLPVPERRRLLQAGGALTLGFVLPASGIAARLAATAPAPAAVNSWLTIGSDNSIVLTIGSSDMGQGSFAGFGQILAEDLMVDAARVQLRQGMPTLATPAPLGSSLDTVGSSITRSNFWRLRDAAASAREMLVAAAMARIGDPVRSNYGVDDGVVRHAPSGRTLSYGEVAAAAALLPVPSGAALVPDDQWRSIGRSIARQDIPFKVDGSAVYGLDVRVPGMVYAVIRHCPSFGGTLAATPPTPAGMIAVIPTRVVPGTQRGLEAVGNVNAVAVVGNTTWDAWQAARRIAPQWRLPANAAQLSSAQFIADAQALMTGAKPYVAGGSNPPGTLYTVEQSTADAEAAIAASPTALERTYTLPYLAHACLEVLNCTVDFVAGQRCEIWAPTQAAAGVLSLAASLTGLAPDRITVHTTYLGGGLGRKYELDFVSQALQVAIALQRPVKLMWPREEDFTHDQYRPMALVRVRAGLDAGRQVTGWSYRNVSPSIFAQRGIPLGATGDSMGYEAAEALPYAFGARCTQWVSHTAAIPVGFWRSVGASINTFAVESMIDELAAAAGEDPFSFRRSRLTDPRWIAVLEAAANAAGWTAGARTRSSTTGRGIAIGTAFGSLVAQVVEVQKTARGGMRVARVTVAIDCYLPVNPGSIEAQVIGGVVHAMNATLYGRQTFANGAAQVKNFNRSRMIRLAEMPTVNVVVLPPPAQADRNIAIGGVGELGVPTFAPALANAWAALTGQRLRTLPFYPDATMSDG